MYYDHFFRHSGEFCGLKLRIRRVKKVLKSAEIKQPVLLSVSSVFLFSMRSKAIIS